MTVKHTQRTPVKSYAEGVSLCVCGFGGWWVEYLDRRNARMRRRWYCRNREAHRRGTPPSDCPGQGTLV